MLARFARAVSILRVLGRARRPHCYDPDMTGPVLRQSRDAPWSRVPVTAVW